MSQTLPGTNVTWTPTTSTAAAVASNLSAPNYGYDVVVALTQNNINTSLTEYLYGSNQPTNSFCFVLDPKPGAPLVLHTLDDFLKISGGINPFKINNISDPNVSIIAKSGFVCGVEIQIGIPSQVDPKHLPREVVVLGNDAHNVAFTMYCSTLSIIQYTAPATSSTQGAWDIWTQPQDKAWYIQSSVNLVQQSLADLNTPYFANFPQQRASIQTQMSLLTNTEFSLQHLMFDLEHAQSPGILVADIPPDSVAANTLRENLAILWGMNASQFGQPPVWVAATPNNSNYTYPPPDPTQMPIMLTSLEYMVSSPVNPGSTLPIQRPTTTQLNLTTLDTLCMSANNQLPMASPFTWNWVDEQDESSVGGIIAIKRHVLAHFIKLQLCNQSGGLFEMFDPYEMTWTPWSDSSSINDPMSVTDSGTNVIHGANTITGALKPVDTYTANFDVYFQGTSIVVSRDASISWNYNYLERGSTTIFDISVSASGQLQMVPRPPYPRQSSEVSALPATASHKDKAIAKRLFSAHHITQQPAVTLNIDGPNSFTSAIFPGGKVFLFRDAMFSDNQDLICSIQYAAPPSSPGSPQLTGMTPAMESIEPATNPAPGVRSIMLAESSIDQDVTPVTPSKVDPSLNVANTDENVADAAPSITYSTELIQNYVQGDLLLPGSNFEALQTAEGHTLLFAIDSAGALIVIHEVDQGTIPSGSTIASGWNLTDISPVMASGTCVGTFGVAQAFTDGSISLAVAVSSESSSLLYLSLGNSISDPSWIENIKWTACPVDVVTDVNSSLNIIGILFAETESTEIESTETKSSQIIIVDVDNSPSSTTISTVSRYHINPSSKSGSSWQSVDLPVDMIVGSYQSRQGRKWRERVDGVYTSGTLDQQAVLVYQPVKNMFGSGPAPSVSLTIPESTAMCPITTVRDENLTSATYGTTTLFAVSGTTLYCFPSNEQYNESSGKSLITDPIFQGTSEILATAQSTSITLWSLSNTGNVYYTTCSNGNYIVPKAWTTPMPIATGVKCLTAYTNKIDGGNTIFLAGSETLQKVVQATSGSGMWKVQDLYITSSALPKTQSFKSYTTIIKVRSGSINTVSFQASDRTAVYINGAYYVLGPYETQITSDRSGLITVVEPTKNINGTRFTVSCGSEELQINPMEAPFQKLTALNTSDQVRDASVPIKTVAGGTQGPTTPTSLVNPSTSDANFKAVASNLSSLQTAYSKVQNPIAVASFDIFGDIGDAFSDVAHAVESVAGDVYRALKTVANAVINGIVQAADGVWHFVAKIGSKIYKAALKTIDAVVGAVEWLFNAVETVVEDVIKFIEMLFEWDDITRTKNVLHKVVTLSLEGTQATFGSVTNGVATTFDSQMTDLEGEISTLTGLTWSLPQMSDSATAGPDPNKGQTSSSMLFAHHYKNQANNLTITSGTDGEAGQFLEDLISAVQSEEAVLSEVLKQLKDLAMSFGSQSLEDVLKTVLGIISTAILDSVTTVVDALFKALAQAGDLVTNVLTCKIHIPIISDILNALGFSDLSFVDLFTWIGAVATTVVYKVVNDGDAPFPAGDFTSSILNATSWDDLQALFIPKFGISADIVDGIKTIGNTVETGVDQNTNMVDNGVKAIVNGVKSDINNIKYSMSNSEIITVYDALHSTAGILTLCDCVILPMSLGAPSSKLLSRANTILGVTAGACATTADFFRPRNPINDPGMSRMATDCASALVLSKLLFLLFSPKANPEAGDGAVASASGWAIAKAWVSMTISIVSMFPSCWHFHELCSEPSSTDLDAAIFTEIGAICRDFSAIATAVAVTNKAALEEALVAVGICEFGAAGMEFALTAQ